MITSKGALEGRSGPLSRGSRGSATATSSGGSGGGGGGGGSSRRGGGPASRACRGERSWSNDASFDAPPPMGSFDEAKTDVSPRRRLPATSSAAGGGGGVEGESKRVASEGKHADGATRDRPRRRRASSPEGKCTEAKHAESKVGGAAGERGRGYKDAAIHDLESDSERSECDRSDEEDESDVFSDETSFEEDDEDEEEETDEEDEEDEDEEEAETDEEEDDEQDEEEEEDSDDDSGDSLSSHEFVEENYDHLRQYVGMDVVVCFGEAWLRGRVARYQPNDGRNPTKVCGLLIDYDKAESEWLRDVDGDPDVQVLEPGMSWAQRFNATDVGDSVIGLYNSASSIWCPGVVVQKVPTVRAADSPNGERVPPRFVVRFENGQSGTCTCDNVVPVRLTPAQLAAADSADSLRDGGGRSGGSSATASPKHGGGGGGCKSPSSWSFVEGEVSEESSNSDASTSSEDDEDFTGHRRSRSSRLQTPPQQHGHRGSGGGGAGHHHHHHHHHQALTRRQTPPSIEFSWQQEDQAGLRAADGPPKDRDCDSAVFPRRPSGSVLARADSRGSLQQQPPPRGSLAGGGGGSGRNLLLKQAVAHSGSRENLLHDPQKLLDLPLEELVEGGFARQVLSDVTRSPRMERERIDKWSHCKCKYEDAAKTNFYLYEERTGEVLLAAKRIGDDFYISQYAEFPDLVTAKNVRQHAGRVCGVLHFCTSSSGKGGGDPAKQRRARARGRGGRHQGRGLARCQLWSTSCDYCDIALAKYVCGVAAPDDRAHGAGRKKGAAAPTAAEAELRALKALGCRQLLADFTQSNVEIKMGPASGINKAGPGTPSVEARQLTVALPTLATDPRTEQTHHCGWCDRCPRNQESTLQLVSAVPEWNTDAQRLTMCFEEAHVREHSSKNFLVHEVADPLEHTASHHHHHHYHRSKGSSRKSSPSQSPPATPKSLRGLAGYSQGRGGRKQLAPAEKRACLQFGKSSQQLFTLSYRYPMSPMQGFGIALSHFNWMPDK